MRPQEVSETKGKAMTNYKVIYQLKNSDGTAINGKITRVISGSNFITNEKRAKQRVSWHVRNIGLDCDIISAVAVKEDAHRLSPLKIVETPQQRKARLSRERYNAKKAQAVAA